MFQDAEDDNGAGDDGLGGGAIAGIVVGGVAAVVIVLALAWWFLRRRKIQRRNGTAAAGGYGKTSSMVEGERQDMYPGEYMGDRQPASPYQGMTLSLPLFFCIQRVCIC